MFESRSEKQRNNHEPRPGWAVVVMVLLATLAAEVVIGDGATSRIVIAAMMLVYCGLIVLGRHFAARWRSRSSELPLAIGPIVLGSVLWVVVIELVRRQVWSLGHPLEVLLICGFRNVALVLAAFSVWSRVERLGGAASLFLMLFAVMAGDDPFLYFVLFAFTLIGSWWLMSRYWNSLAGRMADETRSNRPLRWFVVLPVLMVATVLLVPLSGRTATEALPGVLSSSGGTGEFSPYARSGVGNGDMLVAGTKDVQSFAPIDDAPFMDSEKPSLFDVYNEVYDEPTKPRDQDRAIALPPQVLQDIHRHLADSKQAGREFSTLRKSTAKRRSRVENRDTDALFFVAGRTPLHLRLEVYATFDGITWYPDSTPGPTTPLTMRTIDDQPWLDLIPTKTTRNRESELLLATPETHALKIAQLETNRIPSPPELLGVHINSVDRVDMFDWAADGVLKMHRRKLPSMTVIHVLSRAFDLAGLEDASAPATGMIRHRQLPESFHVQQIGRLAKRWTEGSGYGWPRILRIIERLRTDFEHDHDAKPPADVISPVSHFLKTRRGPDYQFATAAALMIRSLGYPARVVSGFYVRPDKYDSRSRHTPVHAEDAHFWVEVYHSDGVWVPLEPTPGYELLGPPPGLWEVVETTVVGVGVWLADHRWFVLAMIVTGCVLWRFRRRLTDGCELAWWRLRPFRTPQAELIATWNLMERRWRRYGHTRPVGLTATRWLECIDCHRVGLDLQSESTTKFLHYLDVAKFSAETELSGAGVHRICQTMLAEWSPQSCRPVQFDRKSHSRFARLQSLFGRHSVPTSF